MTEMNIYKDIAERTGGNIYIGVVGPVRTGKSTFIKRFMETMVLPEIEDVYSRERAKDELPQSGSGKTIMTAEPKFIPESAVEIVLGGEAKCSVRLVDSVGFMVNGAVGNVEDGAERMVLTPWYDYEIPMSRAAEEGTNRVICDHSTIGVLITTDGSIGTLERDNYEEAEEKAAEALNKIGKPYVILLNCTNPESEASIALAKALTEKYGHCCLPVNCAELTHDNICKILNCVLYLFPTRCYRVFLPQWIEALDDDNELKKGLFDAVYTFAAESCTVEKVLENIALLKENDIVESASVTEISFGSGDVSIEITLPQALYYSTISSESGFTIKNDSDLMQLLRSLSDLKEEYSRVHDALEQVRETGYGVVMPTIDEMIMAEPEIVRQGGRYGVQLKAGAPAIHMIKTDIETEVSPAIGGEKASDEVMSFLLQSFDGDMSRIWESNIFGKSLNDIAAEGLFGKINAMPVDVREKLRGVIQRIVNEGSGGLICILL